MGEPRRCWCGRWWCVDSLREACEVGEHLEQPHPFVQQHPGSAVCATCGQCLAFSLDVHAPSGGTS